VPVDALGPKTQVRQGPQRRRPGASRALVDAEPAVPVGDEVEGLAAGIAEGGYEDDPTHDGYCNQVDFATFRNDNYAPRSEHRMASTTFNET